MFGPRASRPLMNHEAGGTPAVRIMTRSGKFSDSP